MSEEVKAPEFDDWLSREDSGDVEQLQRCWLAARAVSPSVDAAKQWQQGFEAGCAFAIAADQENLGHLRYMFNGRECCKKCGLVWPANGWKKPCKEKLPEISLRSVDARAAEEIVGTVFRNTSASPETLERTMKERIEDYLTKHISPPSSGPTVNQAIQIVERYRDECQRDYDECVGNVSRSIELRRITKVDAANELLTQLRAAQGEPHHQPSSPRVPEGEQRKHCSECFITDPDLEDLYTDGCDCDCHKPKDDPRLTTALERVLEVAKTGAIQTKDQDAAERFAWIMGRVRGQLIRIDAKQEQAPRVLEGEQEHKPNAPNPNDPKRPCWASTTKEACIDPQACDDRGCQLYAGEGKDMPRRYCSVHRVEEFKYESLLHEMQDRRGDFDRKDNSDHPAQPPAEQQRVCTMCGHNNVNSKGECRQCIDWQKHECVFKEEGKEDGK